MKTMTSNDAMPAPRSRIPPSEPPALVPWVEVWRWRRRCYLAWLMIAALAAVLLVVADRR